MKRIAVLLLSLLVLMGCENDDNDWGPEVEGNYTVRVINNLNEDIQVEYKKKPNFNVLDVVTDGTLGTYDRETTTVSAHGEKDITVYFSDGGTGMVKAIWNGKEKEYKIPVERRVVSVDPEDFD